MLSLADPTGDHNPGANTGADITQMMWARDLNNTYFRMDLYDGNAGASIYGIYVDDNAGPGSPTGDSAMPAEYDGEDISYFTTVRRNNDYLIWSPEPRQYVWNTMTNSFDLTNNPANGILFQVSPYPSFGNPGTVTLEWQIPNAQLPTEYSFWAGTMSYDLSGQRRTVDITGAAVTPEPTTLALLGLGVGGIFLKRRRSKS
jgi:hypothetical protein